MAQSTARAASLFGLFASIERKQSITSFTSSHRFHGKREKWRSSKSLIIFVENKYPSIDYSNRGCFQFKQARPEIKIAVDVLSEVIRVLRQKQWSPHNQNSKNADYFHRERLNALKFAAAPKSLWCGRGCAKHFLADTGYDVVLPVEIIFDGWHNGWSYWLRSDIRLESLTSAPLSALQLKCFEFVTFTMISQSNCFLSSSGR